jgi:uncharacterized OB-fold protein
MTASGLPAPVPERSPDTEEFWAATTEGRLLLPRCGACGTIVWYPRARCPACAGVVSAWVEASGEGVVYSVSVVHRGPGPYRDCGPYTVAYVELDEGPRVLTNVVGCPPEDVRIGQRVRVVFDDTGEGSALYRFEPVEPVEPE